MMESKVKEQSQGKPSDKRFLMNQRAFLKLYLLEYIQVDKKYAKEYTADLKREFFPFSYEPSTSEVYKTLHELTKEEYLVRTSQKMAPDGDGFQEIIYYRLTKEGKEKADLYKAQMKVELDRCIALLEKARTDHYGPLGLSKPIKTKETK